MSVSDINFGADDQQLSELLTENDTLVKQIEQIKMAFNHNLVAMGERDQQIDTMQRDMEKFSTVKKDLKALRQKHVKLQEQLTVTTQSEIRMKEMITRLEFKLEAAKKDLSLARKATHSAEASYYKVKDEMAHVRTEKTQADTLREEAEEEAAELRAQLAIVHSECRALRREREQAEFDADERKDELQDALRQAERYKSQRDGLRRLLDKAVEAKADKEQRRRDDGRGRRRVEAALKALERVGSENRRQT